MAIKNFEVRVCEDIIVSCCRLASSLITVLKGPKWSNPLIWKVIKRVFSARKFITDGETKQS